MREKIHPVIGAERDEAGRITAVLHARETDSRESVMHFELERQLSSEELMELCDRMREVLGDVQAAVRDFRDMRERVPAMVEAAHAAAARYSADEVEEAVAFLGWLFEDNFLFLGYREYAIEAGAVSIVPGSGLGILADEASSHYRDADAARLDRAAAARAHHRRRPAARVEDEPVRDRAPPRADGLRRCQARRCGRARSWASCA